MKKPFEEAAELFRESENCVRNARPDEERASFYRGLILLAEGLNRLDRRVEELENSTTEDSHRIVRRFPRRFPARILKPRPVPTL